MKTFHVIFRVLKRLGPLSGPRHPRIETRGGVAAHYARVNVGVKRRFAPNIALNQPLKISKHATEPAANACAAQSPALDYRLPILARDREVRNVLQEQQQRFRVVRVEDAGQLFVRRRAAFHADVQRAVVAIELRRDL